MNLKVLNIVKFTVVDRVNNNVTGWDEVAIFYEDGSVKLVSVDEAIMIAEAEKIEILNTTPELLIKNYDKLRSVSCRCKKSRGTKSGKDLPFLKRRKNNLKKKRKLFFGRKAILISPFRVIGKVVYGKIKSLCEWLTVHVISKFDKMGAQKKEKKTLRHKVLVICKSIKKCVKKVKNYVQQRGIDRRNKRKKRLEEMDGDKFVADTAINDTYVVADNSKVEDSNNLESGTVLNSKKSILNNSTRGFPTERTLALNYDINKFVDNAIESFAAATSTQESHGARIYTKK